MPDLLAIGGPLDGQLVDIGSSSEMDACEEIAFQEDCYLVATIEVGEEKRQILVSEDIHDSAVLQRLLSYYRP